MSAAAIPAAAAPGLARTPKLHPQELLLSAAGPHGSARFDDSIRCTSDLALEVRLTVPVPAGSAPPESSVDFAAGTGKNATHATAWPTLPPPAKKTTHWPAVLHLSGFQCVASQYQPLAARLATHGYACVQYTLPRLWPAGTRIVPDEAELAALGPVWAWAAARAARAGLQLDAGRVAVAGHSRGGKLAALHYARQWVPPPPLPPPEPQGKERHCRPVGRQVRAPAPPPAAVGAPPSAPPPPPPPPPPLPRLRALFLADPVDNTPALARRGYPSGVDALRAAVRAAAADGAAAARGQGGKGLPPPPPPPPTLALACAGKFGGGNPAGSNWLEFLSAAPPGARSLLLHSAGHATFLQIPPDGTAAARALDLLFGGGPAPRPLVMALTAGAMLAWLRREVLVGPSAAADDEEARWLGQVARAAEGAAAAEAAAAGGGGESEMVRVSAQVKLGAGLSQGEGVEAAEGEAAAMLNRAAAKSSGGGSRQVAGRGG